MSEEKEKIIIFESSASYELIDENNQSLARGGVRIKLDEESLSVLPQFGEPLFLPLRDIVEISESDYKVFLLLTSREKLILSDLGYKYEDFLRILSRVRNELLLKDLLMSENLKKSGVEAEWIYFDENGNEKEKGKCEPRLYETAMVIIPGKGELLRLPFSDISEVKEEDYSLVITTEFGEKIKLAQMGKQFDPFKKSLSEAMNELSLKVQSSLKELLPKVDLSVIRRAARFMKEGKAARRKDLESISPDLWKELEMKLESAGIKEEYNFLKSISQEERICIGLKRGLLGDLTGEYIWFLIPIYSTNVNEPGNAVAMEAVSGEGGGKATYFFRIVSRKDYPKFKNLEDLHKEFDAFLRRINRAMLTINFRREPIYLPEDRLKEPRYQKYQFAVQKIPALRELRQLFIGRVIHTSPEQWKKDVMELLKYNVSRSDDGRWEKGEKIENEIFYVSRINFDPNKLRDITDTLEAQNMFKESLMEGIIPSNSKVRLQFKSFCLDEDYPAPSTDEPMGFSYEMLDVPLFLKIFKYVITHPELEQSLVQKLIWNLPKKLKFNEFSEEERQLLFKIDPYADAEIDNYEYGKVLKSEAKLVFDQQPKEVLPQPVPDSEIYGKPTKIGGYSKVEIEFYNPTSSAQKLKLIKDNPGVLTLIPKSRNKFQRLGGLVVTTSARG